MYPEVRVKPNLPSNYDGPIMEPQKIQTRDKHAWIAKNIHGQMQIIFIKDIATYYYKSESMPTFEPLSDHQLMIWVRDCWLGAFGAFLPREIKDAMEIVKQMTDTEIPHKDATYIYIGGEYYWDRSSGDVTKNPKGPSFYRLFDTSIPTRHTVRVEPFNDLQMERFIERYERTKSELNGRQFNCPYEFIMTWANGDKDIAADIIRANAYCYLKKKPLGSVILVGLKRNGKSTFIDMLHTQFGSNNTSRVQLTQLGDPHFTHTLRQTLLNAPDEEEEQAVKYQGVFKTMADHGVISLPVMRSNEPVQVHCDFMSFFPMNHSPEWKGTGASACVQRSLIIPFENDLSKNDKASKNFCEETFTADMFCEYMGTVFAYAWYYHRHEHEFSPRMLLEQQLIQEDLDSTLIYRREFEKFYDGFESLKDLYEDYQNWCLARETKIGTFKQFKFVFKAYADRRTKYTYGGKVYNVYRYGQKENPGRKPLLAVYNTEVGSLASCRDKHCSLIEQLMAKYDSVFASPEEIENAGEDTTLFSRMNNEEDVSDLIS